MLSHLFTRHPFWAIIDSLLLHAIGSVLGGLLGGPAGFLVGFMGITRYSRVHSTKLYGFTIGGD